MFYHCHPAPAAVDHPTDPTDAHTEYQSSKQEHTEAHQSQKIFSWYLSLYFVKSELSLTCGS